MQASEKASGTWVLTYSGPGPFAAAPHQSENFFDPTACRRVLSTSAQVATVSGGGLQSGLEGNSGGDAC